MSSSAPACTHPSISFDPSRHASQAGFKRPDSRQRLAANKSNNGSGSEPNLTDNTDNSRTFPAPLVLPEDEIAYDPEYPPQSFQVWLDDEDRNPVTRARRTVYIVPAPQITDEVGFVWAWVHPRGHSQAQGPSAQDVREYLGAFYHGIPVKLLPQSTLRFVTWDEASKSSARRPSRYIGLATADECIRIRARRSQDAIFNGQLNLNDLLDAAISMLPADAYALLLLVDHDLYEDDDDDFACGRAYGGSRVAVVSSARYNPALDGLQAVEREHGWPASHCERYITSVCDAADEESGKRAAKRHKPAERKRTNAPTPRPGPLDAAISIHRSLPATDPTLLSSLWLARVCRTASHELGHCFGIDHCMYYACVMQGTASISEDAAQPPYLCPVDLAKVLRATAGDARERYAALLAFCEQSGKRGAYVFDPFAAWVRGRLDEMDA